MTRSAAPRESSTRCESATATGVFWRLGACGGPEPIVADGDPPLPATAAERADELRRCRATARRWVRDLVTTRLGVEWTGFEVTTPGRKPRLLALPDVDVSISHSGRTLLVAVVRGGRLGVDVEEEPFDAFGRAPLVRRMCTASERARVAQLPDASRRRALARLWTIKEAALKAMGVGLAVDPRRIVVPDAHLLGWGRGPERSIVHLTGDGFHVFRPTRLGDDEAPSSWRGLRIRWSG